jgi:hypothetical protein
MSARFAPSDLSESTRSATARRAPAGAFFAGLLALACALLVSACSDDSKAPEAATTTVEQINAAPPAPYALSQHAPAETTQVALPPNTFQTPPPASSQLGAAAAASDSLAPPVIHTVD